MKIKKLPLIWECRNLECPQYKTHFDWDKFEDGTPTCECEEDMVYLGVKLEKDDY